MSKAVRLSLIGLCAAGATGIIATSVHRSRPSAHDIPTSIVAPSGLAVYVAVDQKLITGAIEIGKLKNHAERVEAITKLLRAATDAEFEAILNQVWATYGKDLRLLNEIVDFWSERSARSAAQWAQRQTYLTGKDARLLREKTALAWFDKDKEAAFKWMLSLPDREEKWGLAAQTLSRLATNDPKLAVRLLKQGGLTPRFQSSLSVRIFEAWAQHDPIAAFAELGQIVDNTYGPAYTKALSEWGRRDPDAAMSWLMSSPSNEIVGLADRLATSNRLVIAQKLFDEYQALTEKMSRGVTEAESDQYVMLTIGFHGVLQKMAEQGDNAFADWLKTVPNERDRANIINTMVYGYETNHGPDLNETVAWKIPIAQQISDPEKRAKVLGELAAEWAGADPEAALKWLQTQTDPALQSVTYATSLGAVARTQGGEKAMDMVDPSRDAIAQRSATVEILLGWSDFDPAKAATWSYENLGTKDGVDQKTLSYSVEKWAARDANAAIDWLNSVDNQQIQKELGGDIANSLGQIASPSEAPALLEKISDSAVRENALVVNARNWLKQDKAEATAWINKSSLPTAVKRSLLE